MNVIERVQENLSASRCFYSFSLLPPLLATRMKRQNFGVFWTFFPILLKHSRKFFRTLKTASSSQVLQSRTFYVLYTCLIINCKRFEPISHFISRWSMIVRVNLVLNRTVVDSN